MIEKSDNQLAHACTEALHENDFMAKRSGMNPVSLAPGKAVVTMHICREMLNGHKSCHGGMIFALADTAFAHACNNRNEVNVAMDCRIDFIKPAYEGDELTATACELHKGRSSSLYQTSVRNQHGKIIALFQGRSHQLNKPVIEPEIYEC